MTTITVRDWKGIRTIAPLRRVIARQVPGTYNGLKLECGHVIPRLMCCETWVKAKRCPECPPQMVKR